VNIAYVENGNSVNGVVYAPALNVLYYTKDGKSFKRINGEENELPLDQSRSEYIVVASRSHLSSETKKFIDELEKIHKSVEIMNIGSSLKLCMIAEGAADCYPRLGPTMEWDIAAAQAVVEASGGSVLELHKKNKLTYNKENLLNPYFVVRSE
jgi:3'(2'), 5'-bisphosphate nucleotidase